MDEGPALPLTQRLTLRHWVAMDIVLAVVLATASIVATVLERHPSPGGGWDVVRYVAIGVTCLAVPLRRRSPWRALYVVTPAIAVLAALGSRGPTLIAAAAVVYSVAATTGRRASVEAAACVVGATVVGAMAAQGGPAWAAVLSSPPVVLVGWLAGENTRVRRVYVQEMVERTAELERERADRALRAVADERLRIARDLHDIVAHAMSVVAIYSGVAGVLLDTQPDKVRDALKIIETTSKRALAEMRLMVGVLRRPEEGAELGPAPGLADLPELVEQVRQSGVDVEVDVEGDPQPLPAGVDLSAYRIIQEALTNVVRHAGPTTAHLTVRHRRDQLDIEVVDEGARNGRMAVLSSVGQGNGLVGMRERVGLFGGALTAAAAGPGFRVFASLPFDEATR
ncbi:MAG TPA: histidine kinase [Acidimicrobiales bacterium]|nr:histidine kinase [Acidimicrobiales bacterium]